MPYSFSKKVFAACFALIFLACAHPSHRDTVIPINSVQATRQFIYDAENLWKQEKYVEAIPILEKAIEVDPTDEHATLVLGVTLLKAANSETDQTDRNLLILKARQVLINAKQLGNDDPALDSFRSEKNAIEEVQTLAFLWSLSPPQIFESPPPKGIHLLNGYRHTSSTDFEGMKSGTIWKPNELKIRYVFAGNFQSESYKLINTYETRWVKEKTLAPYKFKYALSTNNELIITAYAYHHPIADFYCDIHSDKDIETVMSVVTGLSYDLTDYLFRSLIDYHADSH